MSYSSLTNRKKDDYVSNTLSCYSKDNHSPLKIVIGPSVSECWLLSLSSGIDIGVMLSHLLRYLI